MSMMARVSRTNKCPICNSDTWCLIGRSVILCMRTVAARSKTLKGGEVAYIHPHPDPNNRPVFDPRPTKKPPQINAKRVLHDWSRAYGNPRLPELAKLLGVSVDSLEMLGFQYAGSYHNTWGVPMLDGYGNYIGIRMRNLEGRKWAITGSQAGIFVPFWLVMKRMFVVEGPTDTAAGLTLNLYTIGRPSCSGGVTHIVDHVKRNRIKEVVIIADNDEPGIRGAQDLQPWLPVASCILILPCKDLREFIEFGDKSTIDSMIEQLVWTQPKETV